MVISFKTSQMNNYIPSQLFIPRDILSTRAYSHVDKAVLLVERALGVFVTGIWALALGYGMD